MEQKQSDSATNEAGLNRKGKVICGLEPSAVDSVIRTLADAQFRSEQIEVIWSENAERLHLPPEDCGFSCQLNRAVLSMGADLDELEWEREELKLGNVLVCVPAESEDEQYQVRDILREHGGRLCHYYGRWTIKDLA
jgi:hypothetical protein